MSRGRMSSTARFRMYLPTPPRSFRRSGTVAANSTNWWSRKGTRLSMEQVLLHEQLDEVGFLVRVEHAREQGGVRLPVPVMQEGIVSSSEGRVQQAFLLGAGKGGVEVIEVEGFQIFAAAQYGMLQLAADIAGKQVGAGDPGADGIAPGAGHCTVELQQPLVENIRAIAGIPAEQFVAAFAGEDDLHLLRSQARHKIQRNAGRPTDGLILMPDQLRQRGEKIVPADDYFVVLGADLFRDLAGVGQLAESLLAVADGESFDRPAGYGLHESGDRALIDAAGEKHAERHIAHEARADGLFQTCAAFGDPGLVVALGVVLL